MAETRRMGTGSTIRTSTTITTTRTAIAPEPIDVGTAPLFDSYVMVDWSAAGKPARGKDSIWICHGRRIGRAMSPLAVENVPTRQRARERLARLFAAERAAGRTLLAGFDFAFGYPDGLAARLGLADPPWRALWDLLAAEIIDAADNANNRFAVAARLNERISGGASPFWGCPAGHARPCLQPRHHRRHDALGLPERRIADAWLNGPQPVWKLAYTGSVGSQSLTGIPVLRALRDAPAFVDAVRVWPFETGLRALTRDDTEGRIVLAEIYPSLLDVRPRRGEVKDRAQVRAVVRHFAALDNDGALGPLFAGDPTLDAAQRRAIEREESWILGVTANGNRAVRSRYSPSAKLVCPSPPRRGGEGRVRGSLRVRDIEHRARGATPLTLPSPPASAGGEGLSEGAEWNGFSYLRDPEAIYRESEKRVEQSIDLSRFPADMHPLVRRLVHAAAEPSIVDDLVWSDDAIAAGRAALEAGAPVLVDAEMVAAGIIARHLPAKNDLRCYLSDKRVPGIARRRGTTRSAAAVELWRPLLKGSVVAIGNAPTALFHLLEMIAAGAPRPALVLGFPVGFVGAAEAKAALAANRLGLAFIALSGRRGGSALAAAAVNALARAELAP
jgi:precorrin-8X/cobalt-precorrin-8 methylmutase